MRPRVSVVVPTYRRPELLERCLEALVTQTYLPHHYEIIVADDGADPETELQLTQWRANGHTVRYVPVSGTQGPAGARNAGWHAARGEIVAFTDDDCIPAPDWLAHGVGAFTHGVVGASGRIKVPLSGTPTDYELNARELEKAEFATANCFYRRAILEAVGGFDERFELAWREDSDLYFRLLEHVGDPERFVRVPEALVVHPIRPAPWGVSLKQQRKSLFNALIYKKHPRLYHEKLPPVRPWHYYAIVGALLTALGAALAGRRRLARTAAALWALMTGEFCRRRLARTSRSPRHVAEMALTSILIPPLSIFWRLRGALKFKVLFF